MSNPDNANNGTTSTTNYNTPSKSNDHRFRYTTERRSSSIVFANQGKAFYIPQDTQNSSAIMEETTPLLNGENNNNNNNYNNDETRVPYNRNSRELTDQERALLKDNNLINGSDSSINSTWEEAVSQGLIKTSILFEMKALIKSSAPMIITFLLQNSFQLASIFSVGHIGKTQLAGVTLGSMTANITGFAAIQGLTTCLDTLCSQAYGAGKYDLVGLNFIRCSIFAITCFIPIGIVWKFYSKEVLHVFVPDLELCSLASNYLQIVCFGIPGFILFECGKRFLQSQNCFHASTFVLMICAPLNIFLNYLFVWKLQMGYIGAPLAVTLNYWLMPIGLLVYILYNSKYNKDASKNYLKCWPSNFKLSQGFQNWSKMIELALPGIIMVEAEFLGFEIVTLMASHLGTTELAAQSVTSSICALAYQIPFSVSIATATRVANYIGASLIDNAQIACVASTRLGLLIGICNSFVIWHFKSFFVGFFTNDEQVIELVSKTIPIISIMEIVDCLNACSSGCLRGQGLQKIGGFINIFAFYIIGIPIGHYLGFNKELSVQGLWIGIVCGLACISILQNYVVFYGSNWDKILQDAKDRNSEV